MAHLNEGAISDLHEKKVIFVGRYTMQKGIPDLFKVWKFVYSRHPDWHLYLYGEVGEDYDFAFQEAQRLGNNIHVNRSTNRIFDKYRESSIFVLTSIYEPFGLVMPEAMSCGLPVVAFDCPYGPRDAIKYGVTGYLIPYDDDKAYIEALSQLMGNVSLRKQMGTAATAEIGCYSYESIMQQWLSLFQEIVQSC
jgi:glycosyltransferase involved in cell wall biosynthesis